MMRRRWPIGLGLLLALGACEQASAPAADPPSPATSPQAPPAPAPAARFRHPSGASVAVPGGWRVVQARLERLQATRPGAIPPRLRWTAEPASSAELDPNVRRSLRELKSLPGAKLSQSSLSRRQLGPIPVAELQLRFTLKRGGELHQRSLLFIPDPTELPPTLIGLHASYLAEDAPTLATPLARIFASLRVDPKGHP